MSKAFIITVDTESDNQWDVQSNQSTNNAKHIPRFQELCENYGFKPVYLIDYSMAKDVFLVEYLSNCADRGCCEIGMHVHAWDTPPMHYLDNCVNGRPYLIEYPYNIMKEKVYSLSNFLEDQFGRKLISHRAGRWAINTQYIDILSECGYYIDCSYTPGINWEKSIGATKGGINYKNEIDDIHYIGTKKNVLEVPMTIKRMHYYDNTTKDKSIFKETAKFFVGRNVWLRPALSSNGIMKTMLSKQKQNYAMFMIHSSELMPGGSPYFTTQRDIESLYERLDELFLSIKGEYYGCTLEEYKILCDSSADIDEKN